MTLITYLLVHLLSLMAVITNLNVARFFSICSEFLLDIRNRKYSDLILGNT